MDNKKIGAFISQQRKKAGLNQRQLAEKLNVTDKAVSRWETGKGMPEVSMLQPLAEELSVSVSELLSGEKYETESHFDEADRIIVNTLSDSKKKTRISVALAVIIALLISAMFVMHYYDNQQMICNIKTSSYNVNDGTTGEFVGIKFDFDRSSRVDGYEFMCYFSADVGTDVVDNYKSYPADKTSYYLSTQEGPTKMRIRAYDEMENGDKVYTDWITVIDVNDENSIDYDNLQSITADEWKTLTVGSTYFDPYEYK